ncbi:hypothetical protein [Sphaerotilus sp.]|uniref:hypothetical protein n=1 Tax=Sphaerotilus sp. TaxID=2093942 RepID=UPI00286E39C2|nr:hypothetical protein [Sphaerotilus sp.]
MNNPTPAIPAQPLIETAQLLAALQAAVTSTLDRKRRLGHYAVVWQDGRPVAIGEDRPDTGTDPLDMPDQSPP